ncbi:von Willebrand factor type A domain protein [Adhaeretor mobilis]|uniref:von Willebrand factor type A domain protein n=2 Tax=Adhaeretor mobilis TaxID=1930276 RepID=A0A517MPX3_9BACT|nr:von Willebrand factor type A domain protein [Adhaeretor mobilis]
MMVLVAVCLPLFLIMAAFAVDVAWMQLVRAELRTATDAASRAGAKTLSLSQDEIAARIAARDAALRNTVAGQGLIVDDSQIEVGTSSQSTSTSRFAFTPGGAQLNAMRVTGQRTASSSAGPVALFLGRVMGVPQFQPQHIATSTQLDRDICLVVDRSGSMMRDVDSRTVSGSNCGPPNPTLSRWAGLNNAVLGFLNELDTTPQTEKCGLVSYSDAGNHCGFNYTTSDINAPLDFSYAPIRSEMAFLGSRAVRGNTNIHAGIQNGRAVLTSGAQRPFAIRTMVLMTDGRHNTGPEPVLAARLAADEDITIHTITFSFEAGFSRMQAVAAATGGTHFHAPDSAALERIFREIASTLPVMLTE